jgi:hypothetical protein
MQNVSNIGGKIAISAAQASINRDMRKFLVNKSINTDECDSINT